MAKDPAFLFYSADFLTGTMFMNNEQIGKYIKLICAQHQTGHLSEKDMLNICGSYDENIWNKFIKDDNGKFYNIRCEEEINKRKNYSLSRSNNRLSVNKDKKHMKNTSKTYVKHMENENVIENINKFKKPSFEEIKEYCIERKNSVDPEKWLNHYEANGWKVGKNAMKDWKASVRTWEKSEFNKNHIQQTKKQTTELL